jgi:serine/threonine protein kinase
VSAIPNRRIEGKYEVLEKIREGGMGAIYKVRHRLLDEVRVIKLMRPQLGDDPEFKARFIREARVAIKLRHPNIAHLYDFTLGDDDTAYIVMEFIAGRTLEELLKTGGPPPLDLALEIAQQSLRALGYLHGKGFVHRDISPDNLMLAEDTDGEPQVKLIDLGITKVLEGPDARLTKTGTFLGKLRYASPEQFGAAGAPSADARGDLYSFGVVLYELLTGVHPILGSDPSSIIAGHLFRPPLSFDETDRQGRLPAGLRAAVLRALAKSPDERYASARELAQQLAAFRVPGDLLQGEWRRLIEQPDRAASGGVTSSTQHRLDEHFAPTTTPTPSMLVEVAKAAGAGAPGTAAAPANAGTTGVPVAPIVPVAPVVPAPTSRRPSETRRRTPHIERHAAEIRRCLDRGDVEGGASLLAAAAAELGESAEWRDLAARIEALRGEMRLAKVGALLMRARQLWANGDLEQAILAAAEARAIEADNPAVQALAEELEAAVGQREKDHRRAGQLAQAAAAVGAKLEAGEIEEASRLLDWAVVRFGATPELREQWEQLEERKRQAQAEARHADHRRADELVRDAHLLVKVEDHEDAARKLAKALELAPGHPAAQALLDQVRAARKRPAPGDRGAGARRQQQ